MLSTMRSSGRAHRMGIGRRKLALAGFLACSGLILSALYLEHFRGLDPCPLCMIQRLFFIALGAVFLVAAIAGPQRGAWVVGGVAALLAAGGGGFAARHVWLQWHPPELESCTADLFIQLQRLPFASVIQRALAATGDCAKVDWTLFGLSIAQWSFLSFVALFVLSIVYLVRRPREQTDWI